MAQINTNDLYNEMLKFRSVYITCSVIAQDLYHDKSTSFIESKTKELYKLACSRNPYVEKQYISQ